MSEEPFVALAKIAEILEPLHGARFDDPRIAEGLDQIAGIVAETQPEADAVVIRTLRAARDEWLREAEGSRRQQEGYQEIADQHGRDADRAEAAAAQLAAALITEGIEP